MKYDLSNNYDKEKFIEKYNTVKNSNHKIELRIIREKRSIKQNAYLHILITLFAIEFGFTIEEAKILLKRYCHFMDYIKKGQNFLKRTRDLDITEIAEFIGWIRNYSSIRGCYLPTAEEYLINQFKINQEIDKNKEFL